MRLPPSFAAVAAASLLTIASPPASWAETLAGKVIFETKCVGCHENGGNVLSPAKTLSLSALERNGYASVESIVELTRNGKGQVHGCVCRKS